MITTWFDSRAYDFEELRRAEFWRFAARLMLISVELANKNGHSEDAAYYGRHARLAKRRARAILLEIKYRRNWHNVKGLP